MSLYVRSFLLIFGALLLINCASQRSEVEQTASVPISVEEKETADAPPENLASTESALSARENEIVCKSEVKVGSKIPTPEVCATRKQWQDQAKLVREQWKNDLRKKAYGS